MENLFHIDTDIFLFFNRLHSECADVFFYYISQTWFWFPLYLFIIFLIIKKWKKQSWKVLLIAFLMVFCTDQTCNLLKNSIKRPRPSHTEQLQSEIHLVVKPNGETYYGGQYGFPSAHAANSAAIALFLILLYEGRKRWWAAVALTWVLLLSYSRLYLGVHYPLDLCCGWLLGAAWGRLAHLLVRRWTVSPESCKEGHPTAKEK